MKGKEPEAQRPLDYVERGANRSGADTPVDRVFAVLDFVAGHPKAVSTADVAKGLNLPLPTTHRLVAKLEERGLLQRVPGTKRFVVGNELVTLAGKTIGSAFRSSRRHAVLQSVAAEIGEQCEIGIVRNNAVVYVDAVRSSTSETMRFDPRSGGSLHCTSTGKLYMAGLPAKARDALVRALPLDRRTDNTITDADVLLDLLAEVRETGWARTNEEYVDGIVGCAVPIRSRSGLLIASLGVSLPTSRVTFAELERFREPLTAAAAHLAETIMPADDG